ncbi:MAG: hypothetical protein WDZ76_10495 [Pseudohongiellaceae bacterium]
MEFLDRTVLIALLILVNACSTQTEYRQAGNGGYGYTEHQISQDYYRIHFKSRGDDTGLAWDYAMLRASELTLLNDFDWFSLVSRETLVDRQPASAARIGFDVSSETVQDCGLLTCRTYQRPVRQYDTGMNLGDRRSNVEVILEVQMGKGMRPSGQQSVDAREAYKNLKPPA